MSTTDSKKLILTRAKESSMFLKVVLKSLNLKHVVIDDEFNFSNARTY